MAESGMLQLAQELLANSKAGKMKWETYGSDTFKVDIPDMSIMISRVGSDYSFRLENNNGVVLDRLYGHLSQDVSQFEMLEEMFKLARGQFLDVEGSIDKALQYLKLDRTGAP